MPKPSPTEAIGTAAAQAAAKAAFHLRLRARGIRDLAVLRAFEVVPRASFVPPRFEALAARDLPVPIACGQTSFEPWLSARAVEALAIEPSHRVLEIGSGSGYVTAVLAQLAGEVLGLERFATLATAAQERLLALGAANAAVVWGDGLAIPAEAGRFDRILVHGAFASVPAGLVERLATGGRLVGAATGGGQPVLSWWTLNDGSLGEPIALGPCRYAALVPGLSTVL